MSDFGVLVGSLGALLLWTSWRHHRAGKFAESRFYVVLGTVTALGGVGVLVASPP